MILTIRPAVRDDAVWISQNLRLEDIREIETASGRSATAIVPEAFDVSRECYTIRLSKLNGTVEEHPAAIFGVSDDKFTGQGVMWLLTTEDIRRAALSVVREAPFWLDRFNRLYSIGIHNLVDTRNSLHIRWLTLMGFTVSETLITINGVPFVHAFRKS